MSAIHDSGLICIVYLASFPVLPNPSFCLAADKSWGGKDWEQGYHLSSMIKRGLYPGLHYSCVGRDLTRLESKLWRVSVITNFGKQRAPRVGTVGLKKQLEGLPKPSLDPLTSAVIMSCYAAGGGGGGRSSYQSLQPA